MDARTTMIIAKGKFVTTDVTDCIYHKENHKWEIVFKSGRSFFYNQQNVLCLKNPRNLDPQKYQVCREGKILDNIETILSFSAENEEYWHLVFSTGYEHDYSCRELQVERSIFENSRAKKVFDYLKEAADVISVRAEDQTAILTKQYEKIDFLSRESAAAVYLDPSEYEEGTNLRSEAPIFPFGCNESQFMAVTNALSNRISVIEGPPGTGKTLIAKAVAGEAGVPFFSISGSDFVEMFVGVGASRVRDMFAEAKKHAPCIVFIDEIDAVGRRRGTGMGGGHDEREQTLNQLLVEMDGFGINEGIIVIAATNRVDILDPALLRPGRFDRKVYVGRPDVGGREQILSVHAKNKPLADDVDLKQIAQTTAGFTGADLENLLNEAAIIAAKDQRMYICQNDIKKAFIKVGIGAEKKSRIITDKEKRITAFHEAGHAILFHLLPDVGPVYTVSIIPTGVGAAGYTMPLPEKDEMFHTKGQMLQEIIVDLGGRVAEELIFEDVTTGASQDIKQATSLAKSMVTKYGMSEDVGLICYDDEEEVFIGRDLGHTRGYSETVATRIDGEIKRIVDECYAKARQMIREHEDVLHRCAELLLEKEKINRDEFEALFEEKTVEASAE